MKIFLFIMLLVIISLPACAELNKELQKTVKAGDLIKVKELLAIGADVNIQNKSGWTALHEAARHLDGALRDFSLSR